MKLIFSLPLFALVNGSQLMSRSSRNQLKRLIQSDLESDNYDNVDTSILTALKSYTNSNDFVIPPSVPDGISNWFRMQTGQIPCEEGCEAGVLEMTPLFGYGCWCFFGNIDSTLGRGPPLDPFDATCKALVQCYRCIVQDAGDEDADCDPFNQDFSANVHPMGFNSIDNITVSCQTTNTENCEWRTCSCAMTMVINFFNMALSSEHVYDDSLRHENGFDYELECPKQGQSKDRQCCGFYPNRRTYDRGDGERDCCAMQTIYNPFRRQCCSDGSIIQFGQSC